MTGVDLVEQLAMLSGELIAPLFLLGAGPGVGAAAAANLRARHPAAVIVGAWGGGTPGPADDAESVERIEKSGARAVAVAYGAPGQITWIARNLPALEHAGVRLAIGVGGALDYHAGIVTRPPALIRRLGLEWAMRLAREPRRWRRQLVLPWFAVLVASEAISGRFRRPSRL
jgi:N-acetylglucosaminyldiphosphoundecaprenol N-acetyl-beta-D-mannosaminyltransferase